jgi:hypothetical protein
MTPDDSCFYREPDVILPRRAKAERFIGRLPRWIAYPLMLAISVALWIPIGVAAVRLAETISRGLQ